MLVASSEGLARGLGGVSGQDLIEAHDLLLEDVENFLGAGELARFGEQFQALRGFPRAGYREIPYRTLQGVCGSFESSQIGGTQSCANLIQHSGALLKKYSRKLFQ